MEVTYFYFSQKKLLKSHKINTKPQIIQYNLAEKSIFLLYRTGSNKVRGHYKKRFFEMRPLLDAVLYWGCLK